MPNGWDGLLDPPFATRLAQIDAASENRPQDSSEECHLTRKEGQQPHCLYGNPLASRRVALFGDSHAQHWFAAMNSGAKRAGWQLLAWTKAGCSPASMSSDVFQGRHQNYIECERWREGVLKTLTESEIPDLVLMSSYVNREDLDLYDRRTGRRLSQSEGQRAWQEGFRQTIDKLVAAGARVVVIRDIPPTDKDYKICLLKGLPCVVPRAQALTYRAIDAEVAREFDPRVTLLDLTDRFCDAKGCAPMRDGIIVYRDDDHMTSTYAVTFAPEIATLLRGFEQGSGQSERKAPPWRSSRAPQSPMDRPMTANVPL